MCVCATAKYENMRRCLRIKSNNLAIEYRKLIFLSQNTRRYFFLTDFDTARCPLSKHKYSDIPCALERFHPAISPTFPAIFHAAPLDRDADIARVALFTTTKKNVEQIDTRRGRPDAATTAAVVALMCRILIDVFI